MSRSIEFAVGSLVFQGHLNGEPMAHRLVECLPLVLDGVRRGGAIEAELRRGLGTSSTSAQHESFEPGEIAYHAESQTLRVFFGGAPEGEDNRGPDATGQATSRATSGVMRCAPLGRLSAPLEALASLGERVHFELRLRAAHHHTRLGAPKR